MTRLSLLRSASVAAALLMVGCLGDSTGPGHPREARLALAPTFESRATLVVPFTTVRVTLSRASGVALDRTIDFPPDADSLALELTLTITGTSEVLTLDLRLINAAGDTVFRGGPVPVTASATSLGTPTAVPVALRYSGLGSNAASVSISPRNAALTFQDSIALTAMALDSGGQPIPGTPIVWSSLDPSLASVPADTAGKVLGLTTRGVARIEARLLTNQADTAQVTVQPVAVALSVVSGNAQTAPVGALLPQPLVARVKAADSLGVQGVPVNISVTTGGGSVSKAADTSDANGDVTIAWTLGAAAGAESLAVTAPSLPGAAARFSATAVAGAANSLAFLVQPSTVPAGAAIAPPVQVAARDSFGNTVTGFTGAVTVAITANPAGGTLSGILTQNAVAGVATFSNLAVDNLGSGYQLAATATGLATATSTAFDVTAPAGVNAWLNAAGGNWSAASNWSKGTVPSATDTVLIAQNGTYAVTVDVAATIQRLTVGGASGTQTLLLNGQTLTVNGTLDVGATGQLQILNGTLTGPGTVSVAGVLDWQGGGLSGGSGTARVLTGGTLSLSGGTKTLSGYTLELDGAGTWTGTGTINSGSAGTLLVQGGASLSVTGDPTISFNLGGTPSLLDNLGTITRTTSANAFVVGLPIAGTGSWQVQSGSMNLQGGGTVSGAMTVSSGATLDFGGGAFTLDATSSISGAGTVSVNGGTVDMGGAFAVTSPTQVTGGTLNVNSSATTGTLDVSGGTLGGSGVLAVSGAMSWTGGNLSGSGGTTRVLSSGSLHISPATTVNLEGYTLELAGTGTWTGTASMNSGLGAVLRVLGGATLDIQGDPTVAYNLGGTATALNVLGILTRTTSGNAAVLNVAVNDSGTVSVQSGSLQLGGGGASSGSFTAASGATLDFSGGTHALDATSSVTGAGTVGVTGGTLNAAGAVAVTGTLQVSGGTANIDGASSSTAALTVSGGTLGGSGLLTVSGPMSWTGGNLSGAGGATRVLSGGTLSIAPATTVSLGSYTLELAGTGTWTGTASMNSGLGAVLRVLGGATLDIQGDPTVAYNLGGTATALDVLGTLTRTTSTNPAVLNVAVNDSGTVSVQSGSLQLGGGGASTGSFTAASGATLDFSGGTHALDATSSVTGAGTVGFTGGAVNGAGAVAVTGTLLVSGGTANLDGAGKSTAALALSGGTLGGSGLLTVSGSMSWTGGNLGGTGGTTRVLSGGTLSIAPATTVSFQSDTLELAGTGTWTGTATVNAGSAAVLRVLSGATLDIQGEPIFTYNLGGNPPELDNLGTITRSVSTGAVTIGVGFNQAGSITIQSGLVNVAADATMSGPVTLASSTVLQFTAGSISLANNFKVTGTAGITQVSGSAVLGGLAATDTAFFDNLDLVGGTLSLSGGTIKTPVSTIWSGSTSFGGGTLFIPAGAGLSLSFTGGVSMQNAAILNAGATVFTAAGTLHSGSGAVIRNLPGATFTFSAAGSYLFDLGGSTSLFDNQGTLASAPPSGNVVVGGALTNTGTIQVVADTLRFSGGSTGSLTGTATVTAGAALEFGGGTFTQTGPLQVNGDLVVSGGSAVPNGNPLAVTGNFATAGSGVLQMTQAADSLGIAGNATFGGGSTTGALTAGIITVGGNFAQSGAATSFAPSTAERVRFDNGSGATQTVSFANPTTSFFDSLVVDRGQGARGTVQLLTDVRVNRGMTIQNSSDITGPTARVTIAGGTLHAVQGTTSPTMKSLAIELSTAPVVGGAPVSVSPDTMVFDGAITALPVSSGLLYNNVRVNTTGAFNSPGNVAYNGDLIVSSGTYAIGAGIDSVAGFLRTEATGALSMTAAVAAPTVAVRDSAVFAGGASTSLTGGLLRVWGNFVERGTGGQFAASGSHRVSLQRSAAGVQTIQFADPVNSYFHDLVMSRPTVDTVRLLSDVTATDSAIVTGSTVLASTALEALTTPVTGVLRIHMGGVLRPSRVVFGTFFADSDFTGSQRIFPDTAVFLNGGAITSSSPAYGWKSVRLAGGTLTSSGTTYNGNLILSAGTYTLATFGATDSITGFLRTEGSGILQMPLGTAPPTVVVGDSAVFAGGSETGQLVSGTLRLYGSFAQRATTTAFAASAGHLTTFSGSGTQTVTFANPGASASTFGDLAIERSVLAVSQSAGITLGSNVYVTGALQDSTFNSTVTDSILGNGFTVTANSLSLGSQFVLNNAPLVTTSAGLQLSALTFRNLSPAATQWTINMPAGTALSLSGLNFQSTPTLGTGYYFAALLSSTGAATMTVTGASPVAGSLTGYYLRTNANGSVTVTWNGTQLP
jgi:hypothetical protein